MTPNLDCLQGLSAADVDFDTTWRILAAAFTEIHTKNASALSFEELYRNAYKLVLKKQGSDLYTRVADFEAEWLANAVKPRVLATLVPALLVALEEQQPHHHPHQDGSTVGERRRAGERFLKALKEAWEDHQVGMGMLTDVLMYMDRVYCTDHRRPSIYATAMGLFRDRILRVPIRPTGEPQLLVVDALTRIILDQIQMHRDGDVVDPFLLKSNVYMLEGLYASDREVEDEKLYLSAFEPVFLAHSAAFYRAEALRLLREADAGTYCRHAQRRLEEEVERCRTMLSEASAGKVQRVVENEMVRGKMRGVIEMESGVARMVANERIEELGLVWELEGRVDKAKSELVRAMREIVEEMGNAVNEAAVAASVAGTLATATGPGAADEEGEGGEKLATDETTAKPSTATKAINLQTAAALQWVEDMLALKDRFDRICQHAFSSDPPLTTAIHRSTADAINAFPRSSEYISLFIDSHLRRQVREHSEQEVDARLDKALVVLRYLQDKDVFETYYKKHLCKRLLLKRSVGVEVERGMIGRMKVEVGNAFTGKLEAMLRDMALSEELGEGFKTYVARLGDRDPRRVELGVKVLTSMTWPLEAFRGSGVGAGEENQQQRRPPVILPPPIQRLKAGFERFYGEKYSGRKLTWVENMGDADLKARFPRSRHPVHEINCSTYAMIILLLFNNPTSDEEDGPTLTLEEIQSRTQIPPADLTRNLQALAVAPKTRFLVKEPMGREIRPGDRFRWNSGFSSKVLRLRVGVVSAGQTGNKVEGEAERRETERRADEGRAFAIEAAVVRIMKYVIFPMPTLAFTTPGFRGRGI